METEAAPAKINLCLHVTGQRADGYHDLDSLVVFAGVGDRIDATLDPNPGPDLRLSVTGPMQARLAGLPDQDNLVIRAARLFGADKSAAIRLDKHLPPASGIGGGSADAAAALRALSRLWHAPLPAAKDILSLGADVPVCLIGQTCRMQGVGDRVSAVGPIAPMWLVLVNPGVPVATPSVFRALPCRDNPPLPDRLPELTEPQNLIDFLKTTRNDLQPAALSIAPVIGDCIYALAATAGCALARMSGSGATCFGLYPDAPTAQAAAIVLSQAHPDWWVVAAPILT